MLFQDFNIDALEKFIEVSTVPIVTVWNSDPTNHPYINKFFESPDAKVLFILYFIGKSIVNSLLWHSSTLLLYI